MNRHDEGIFRGVNEIPDLGGKHTLRNSMVLLGEHPITTILNRFSMLFRPFTVDVA